MENKKYQLLLNGNKEITEDDLLRKMDFRKFDYIDQKIDPEGILKIFACDYGVVLFKSKGNEIYAEIIDYSKAINPLAFIGVKNCLEESVKGISLEEIE